MYTPWRVTDTVCVTGDEEEQRTRSARHYLAGGASSTRLQTTIALAARAVSFPVAMINVLDEDTQHTISLLGADDLATPREVALCDTVVRSGEPLVVEDAGADDRFAHFPLVTGGDVASYVGVPLRGRESSVIGALCVIDSRPAPSAATRWPSCGSSDPWWRTNGATCGRHQRRPDLQFCRMPDDWRVS